MICQEFLTKQEVSQPCALSHSMNPDIHSAHARVSRPLYLHFIPDRDYSVKAVASTFWLPHNTSIICLVPMIQVILTQCR